MSRVEKGTQYVCGVCGTTMVVTDAGCGMLEDVVCCEMPMVVRVAKTKKAKARPKKKSKKK